MTGTLLSDAFAVGTAADESDSHKPTVVIGAGPAGLTAAYLLAKSGRSVVVLESDEVVGGISRTARYKDFFSAAISSFVSSEKARCARRYQ